MSTRWEELEHLDDYLSGAMSEVEAAPFEEALFRAAAEGRAPALAFLDHFTTLVARFKARGGFGGATREQVTELRQRPRVHYLDIPLEATIGAWPSDTELVVYRVGVDLREFQRVDVEITTEDGTHVKNFRDVQPDPTDGALYGVCEEQLAAGTLRKRPFIGRVEGVRNGRRELVATLRVRPG